GLAEVYQRRGDTKRADATRKQLDRAWAGDRRTLDLMRL
ncbi:MAG: hypothetical protein H6R26_1987, partial [Proteobacteria bacterium]|nr:hypothetical protein [Pseudomonadota bacterium]